MAISLALMLFVSIVPSVLGNSISGIVYNDPDENGVREIEENDLANITFRTCLA